LRRRINDTLKQPATSTDKIPQVVAAKQLKSGDISIHAANAAEANQLKDNSEAWVQILGTRARVLKPIPTLSGQTDFKDCLPRNINVI
jgi:hypothetical protein